MVYVTPSRFLFPVSSEREVVGVTPHKSTGIPLSYRKKEKKSLSSRLLVGPTGVLVIRGDSVPFTGNRG